MNDYLKYLQEKRIEVLKEIKRYWIGDKNGK